MLPYNPPAEAACACGAIQVRVHKAIGRFYCHCTICQRVNQAAFGDPVCVLRWHLQVNAPDELEWSRHRWTPLNVKRGACRTCGTVIVEHLLGAPVSFVIGRTWTAPERLPSPRGHVFYETRVADVDDALPKLTGYLRSQLSITRWLVAGLVTGAPAIEG